VTPDFAGARRRRAAISCIRSYVPPTELSNEQLAAEYGDYSAARLLAATGIRVRHVVGTNERASDLAVRAVHDLLAATGTPASAIDFLVYCSQSLSYLTPGTSCEVHERIGLTRHCGACDLNQGCASFIYGLAAAQGLIEAGDADNVLVVTAETYSRYLRRRDRTRAVFSDGAAATLITSECDSAPLIGPFVFSTDGRGADRLRLSLERPDAPAGDGSNIDEHGSGTAAGFRLHMDGQAVFNFTIEEVPNIVRRLLDRCGATIGDVEHFVFHQANAYMIGHLRELIGIPQDRFVLNVESVGNTGASTIPMALQAAAHSDRLRANDRIMLVGFGAGYSAAAAMIRWHRSRADRRSPI